MSFLATWMLFLPLLAPQGAGAEEDPKGARAADELELGQGQAPVEAADPLQEPASSGQLGRARATFAAADRDGDGGLDPSEIRAAGIPGLAAAGHDADADGRLSMDEFLVYYRRLLVNARKSVEPDLERAVLEVLAGRQREHERRRDQQREDLRRRRAQAAENPHPGGVPPRRVLGLARERLVAVEGQLAARPARVLELRPPPDASLPTIATGEGLIEQARGCRQLAGGLLEGRAERLAALRRRMEGAPEQAPDQSGEEPGPARVPVAGAPRPARPGAPVAAVPARERSAPPGEPGVTGAGTTEPVVGPHVEAGSDDDP